MPTNALEQLINSFRKPRLMEEPDPNQDPSIGADAFNVGMQSELRERIFNAQRTTPQALQQPSPNATGPGEVNALRNLLGSYEDERAASPIMAQGKQYAAQNAGNLAAQNEGFTTNNMGQNPMQAREIYKRQQAEQLRRQPVEIESMRQAGENSRQQNSMQHNQRIVEMQMEPAMMNAETQKGYYDQLRSGSLDPNRVKAIGRNGISFQSNQQAPNPNSTNRALETARYALGQSGVENPFAEFHGASPEQQNYAQTVQSIVSQAQFTDPNLQIEVMNILRNPEDAATPFEDLFDAPTWDAAPQDHADYAKLKSLLLQLRGF